MALMLKSRTLTFPESYRLSEFVNTGYEESKLKLSGSEIKEHQEEIISVVRRLCDKLGELYPVFTIGDILGNGSYFHDSKIITPDEADLLLVFKHLSGSNINLSDVVGGNKVEVELCNEDIRTQINEIKQSLRIDREVIDDENNLLNDIRYALNSAIHTCLSQLGGINYRGKSPLGPTSSNWDSLKTLRLLHYEGSTGLYQYHFIIQEYCRYTGRDGSKQLEDSCMKGTYDPYLPQHTIVLDSSLHGPCVRIRLGCNEYTTDIDLGFSIEQQSTVNNRCLVLPYSMPYPSHWTQSLYHNNNTIDTHHNKLLMVLKLLTLECHLVPQSSTYSSHALKTLVLHHQTACTPSERSLGSCLCDVAHRVFEFYKMKEEDGDLWIYERHGKLPDMDYPGVDVKPRDLISLKNYWMMPVLFYITIRALRSGNCTGEQVLHVDRWLVLSELWYNRERSVGYVQISDDDLQNRYKCKIPIQKIDQIITRYYKK